MRARVLVDRGRLALQARNHAEELSDGQLRAAARGGLQRRSHAGGLQLRRRPVEDEVQHARRLRKRQRRRARAAHARDGALKVGELENAHVVRVLPVV